MAGKPGAMTGAAMTTRWRDLLPIHPAAERIPEATEEEKRALAADLARHGLRVPVVLVPVLGEPGRRCLLDGRTRLDLLEAAGVQVVDARGRLLVEHKVARPKDEAEAERLSVSLNVHRRHLTAKQKREIIAGLLKAKPDSSNNVIAKQINADDKTVAKVRRQLEATSEIPRLEKTTGADGKARKQPAKKSRARPNPPHNPLVRAWDMADGETQYEFIRARGVEIAACAFDVEAGSDMAVTSAVARANAGLSAEQRRIKEIADRAEAASKHRAGR
jgi:hypothetical protein